MIRTSARHLGALVLPALLLSSVSPAPAQEPPIKIAVVDIQKIVNDSDAGKQLQTDLDAFRRAVEQELKAKATEVNDLQERAKASSDPAEVTRLSKEYEQGLIDFKRLQDDKQREGQKKQKDGLAAIEKALGPVFSQVRAEQDLDLILARTPGVTLLFSDRVDITELILDRYNAASQ